MSRGAVYAADLEATVDQRWVNTRLGRGGPGLRGFSLVQRSGDGELAASTLTRIDPRPEWEGLAVTVVADAFEQG